MTPGGLQVGVRQNALGAIAEALRAVGVGLGNSAAAGEKERQQERKYRCPSVFHAHPLLSVFSRGWLRPNLFLRSLRGFCFELKLLTSLSSAPSVSSVVMG